MPLTGDDVLKLVTASLDDDKALDLSVIDLHGKTDIADHMVIASGTSERQVGAMADHLREKLKQNGLKGINVEG
ncbi:MAG TPA: ribosome silencing factor, partial [Rhodospirillaceae bacterium]|nr:ribosome silencing factor [Rhodospirillaceae bacterium]